MMSRNQSITWDHDKRLSLHIRKQTSTYIVTTCINIIRFRATTMELVRHFDTAEWTSMCKVGTAGIAMNAAEESLQANCHQSALH
jgi:hypothetical protein